MDKRRVRVFRDRLTERRQSLVGQVQQAELYSRERDAEATQDPADMAANAYTKELLVSMSDNDRQLLNLIDEAAGDRCRTWKPAILWCRHSRPCQPDPASLQRPARGCTTRPAAPGPPGFAGAPSIYREKLLRVSCPLFISFLHLDNPRVTSART